IGRLRKLASPVNVALIGMPATAPITSREPVPELPKSRGDAGVVQRAPVTRQAPWPSRISVAPSARSAPAVLSTSSDSSNPVIVVSPAAIAPRIRARWEIDLSPGTSNRPLRALAFRALRARASGLAGPGRMEALDYL